MIHHFIRAVFGAVLGILLFGAVLGSGVTLAVEHVVRRIRRR